MKEQTGEIISIRKIINENEIVLGFEIIINFETQHAPDLNLGKVILKQK